MPSALQNWGEILRTQRLSPDRVMDTVSRWLLITRASVIPMTVISGAIGGMLAAGNRNADNRAISRIILKIHVHHRAHRDHGEKP